MRGNQGSRIQDGCCLVELVELRVAGAQKNEVHRGGVPLAADRLKQRRGVGILLLLEQEAGSCRIFRR